MPAKPSVVYVLVDTPDHSRAIQEGQEPTTIAAYRCEIEGKDSIEATVQKNHYRFPLGSTLHVTTDAKLDTYEVEAKLSKA